MLNQSEINALIEFGNAPRMVQMQVLLNAVLNPAVSHELVAYYREAMEMSTVASEQQPVVQEQHA
jgi:hypothetical protein